MSSGVTTTVFNFLLLRLAGNVGVAAYGVVANYALVATAVFNGVAQGVQPLASACYGQGRSKDARRLLGLGTATALGLAALLYAGVFGFTDTLVALFNQDGNMQMAQYALQGMRVYFIGYLFAGSTSWPPGTWAPSTVRQRQRRPRCAGAWWPSWAARCCWAICLA